MKPENSAGHLQDCRLQRAMDSRERAAIGGGRSSRLGVAAAAALSAVVCLAACAVPARHGTYAQVVLDRPLPVSEAQTSEECAWIRNEMGRQQEVATRRAIFAFGWEALMNRTTLEQNLIALESRAKAAHCDP